MWEVLGKHKDINIIQNLWKEIQQLNCYSLIQQIFRVFVLCQALFQALKMHQFKRKKNKKLFPFVAYIFLEKKGRGLSKQKLINIIKIYFMEC